MADEEKRIIVDDDWKAEAKQEKERLAEETVASEPVPDASFSELVNMIAMQAVVHLGGVGPGGERIPPSLEISKHFVDMLQVLEDKTKNNLSDEETKLLDALLYELRMRYVQAAGGGVPPGAV